MALIKCSECGHDISEKALICTNCGCPIEVTKQNIEETKEKKKKRIIIVGVTVLVIVILVLIGMALIRYYTKPDSISVHLIKKDFGHGVKVEEIYYNAEVNGCLVKFAVNGEENTATVHLEDKTVGYQSVLDEYTEQSDKATTDDEKQKIAKDIVEYINVYDIFWEYNMLTQGEEESGWERLK